MSTIRQAALVDGKFEPLLVELAVMGIYLNTVEPDEHVGDIERYMRTITQRMRAIYNTLPFKKVLHPMIYEMAKSSFFWMNAFPSPQKVSRVLSPLTITIGQTLVKICQCSYQFGEYVQNLEQHSNPMNLRTIGALSPKQSRGWRLRFRSCK
jgi:hypothetical protein